VAASLDDALQIAEDIALIDGVDELVIIGGAEIYREAMPRAVRLYVTEVHANVTGDAYLPEIDWKVWREVDRERHIAQGDNPYDFSFVVYRRAGT
jgi:dihydrofolate reductase